MHLTHLNPFPSNLGDLLRAAPKVLVPEMNMGQLSLLLRAKFLRNVTQLNKVQGQPFKESEILDAIRALIPGGRR